MKKVILNVAFLLTMSGLFAQTVSLVRDINNTANNYGSYPSNITAFGSSVVFTAQDPLTGNELWTSDGTTTTQLKDIWPGGTSSNPSSLMKIGSFIYFSANDGVNGQELWKTDGTSVGTVLVKDIYTGANGAYPSGFTLFNGSIYFTANDGVNGYELWKTDGTAIGTVFVSDIESGSSSSYPSGFAAIGSSHLVFSAYTAANGQEFYSYDGTSLITYNIYSGSTGSYPSQFVSTGTQVIFTATNAAAGNELWITDGTLAGTHVLADINGSGSSYPSGLTYVSGLGLVFFEAYTPLYGYELWKTDGISTSIVADLVIGTGSSYPSNLTASVNSLFFVAYDATNGYGLRNTTGSATFGTPITGTAGTYPGAITSYGSSLVVFQGYDATNGYELWKSSSTAASLVKDIASGSTSSYPSYMTFTGKIFFSADNGVNGNELWKTDVTAVNTLLVKDIDIATDSNISIATPTATGYLLTAYDGTQQEIWKTDITTGGTTKLSNINPGSYSYATFLGKANGLYFFSAYNPTSGTELWKTDGTTTPTLIDLVVGSNSSYPSGGAVIGTFLYFTAYDATHGTELWKTDGTTTTMVQDINPGINGSYPNYLTVGGSTPTLFFEAYDVTNGYELWKSNGTTATLVSNINLGDSSYPSYLTAVGTFVYFNATDGATGYELWKSDGTTTAQVKDINGSGDSYPTNLIAYNSNLYFQATDGTNGNELWKSDGTSGGTVMVKDIEPGSGSGSPSNFTVSGTNLYFVAYTSINGNELWKSDGTTAGTSLLVDLVSGSSSSYPTNLNDNNGSLYFNSTDGVTGNLLYKANGATAFKATSTGISYDYPSKAYYYNGKLIFSANTNTNGNEPLTVMAEPLNQPTALNFTGKTATTISGSFTAAAGSPSAPAGYIILRKTGSAPTDLPVDGAPYIVGATIGTSTVAAIGAGTTFTDTFTALASPPVYYYAIFSYNNDGAANIYRPYLPLTGNSTPLAAEPTNQPTGLSATSVTTTSFTVSFTSASGGPAGYLALRKAGSTAPTDLPVDATTYVAGNTIGTSTVVYVGSTASFPQTSLSAGTSYSYAIFSYNGAAGTWNYLTSTSGLSGTLSTLVAEPTSQPSGLVFSSVTTNSQALSFSGASGGPTGYIVVRNTSPSVNDPIDGSAYAAGAVIGSSVVAYSGSATNFSDASLSAGTLYYYQAYSYNGSGSTTNYYTTSPLTGNSSTLALEPTTQPTGFTASSITTTSYTIAFTAPVSLPDGYIVLRVQGTTPPTDTPVDGATYSVGGTIGSSTVAYSGSGTSFGETGITPGQSYSYAIFARNGSLGSGATNYLVTSPLTGTASTLASVPSAQPTALVFSSTQAASMSLAWTAASGGPNYLVIRKVGSAPTGVPVNGNAYVAGNAMGDGTVAFSGSASTLNDTGLSSASQYFYQIFSYNGSGAGSNYLTASPLGGNNTTLDAEPVIQPTALLLTNAGLTSLSVAFTASASAPVSGYIVIRNATSAATGLPIDGTTYAVGNSLSNGTGTVAYVGSNASFQETTLSSQTTYFYSVYAFNNAAGPINYLTTSPLNGSATTLIPDTTPPVVNNSTPATVASGLSTTITATATDPESGVASVSLQYRSISGSTSYTTVAMTLVSGSTTNYQSPSISSSQIGDTGLDFKIAATNGQGGVTTSPSFKSLLSFASENLPYTTFGSAQTNYRLISVPLTLTDNSVRNVFAKNLSGSTPTYDNTKWRLFQFDNSTQANKELSDLSATIAPGKGYWFIASSATTINTGAGNAVNVSADNPFTISLGTGWNLIGNPYLFNVSWSEIQQASGNISPKLRTYTSSGFVDAAQLNKFEGGFVMANAPVTLTIPTTKNTSINSGRISAQNEPMRNSIDKTEWEIPITLQNGAMVNGLTGVGMNSLAKDDYDQYDDFTLPRLFDYLELNHQKSFIEIPYSKDVVPTSENHTWEFSVDSNLKGITEMRWDNSYFGNNAKEVVLVDSENQWVVDLKQISSYQFESTASHRFKIVFGEEAYVKDHSLPLDLIINRVYPNPSGATVTVGFTTPDSQTDAPADVKIINMMGQPVSHLFDGLLSSGYHELTWSGASESGFRVSPGVYIIEVQSGVRVRTEKLIIK